MIRTRVLSCMHCMNLQIKKGVGRRTKGKLRSVRQHSSGCASPHPARGRRHMNSSHARSGWGFAASSSRLLGDDSLVQVGARIILSDQIDVLDLWQSECAIDRVDIDAHQVDHLAITLNLRFELAALRQSHLNRTLCESNQLQIVRVGLACDGLVGHSVGELLLDQVQLKTRRQSRTRTRQRLQSATPRLCFSRLPPFFLELTSTLSLWLPFFLAAAWYSGSMSSQ